MPPAGLRAGRRSGSTAHAVLRDRRRALEPTEERKGMITVLHGMREGAVDGAHGRARENETWHTGMQRF
jgi:hypothetical protein